jgi:CspA family cold shock protein
MADDKGGLVEIESVEGEVKWFDARKGFGFIVGPNEQDVFVHFSVIEQESGFRTLKDGERVTYSATKGPKGWSATRVSALSRTSVPSSADSS